MVGGDKTDRTNPWMKARTWREFVAKMTFRTLRPRGARRAPVSGPPQSTLWSVRAAGAPSAVRSLSSSVVRTPRTASRVAPSTWA